MPVSAKPFYKPFGTLPAALTDTRVIGRGQGGGDGDGQQLTLGAGLSMSGTVLDASGAGLVPTSRTLTAGAGLTGGGDLSANRTFDVGANADGSVVVNANDVQVGVLATDAQHGVRGGGTQHAAFTSGAAGFAPASGGGTANMLRADVSWTNLLQHTALATSTITRGWGVANTTAATAPAPSQYSPLITLEGHYYDEADFTSTYALQTRDTALFVSRSIDGGATFDNVLSLAPGTLVLWQAGVADPSVTALGWNGVLSDLTVGDVGVDDLNLSGDAVVGQIAGTEAWRLYAPAPGGPGLVFSGTYATLGAAIVISQPSGNVVGPDLSFEAAQGGPGNNNGGRLRLNLAAATGAGSKGDLIVFDTDRTTALFTVTATDVQIAAGMSFDWHGELNVKRQGVTVWSTPDANSLYFHNTGTAMLHFSDVGAGNPSIEFLGAFISGKAYFTVGGHTAASAGKDLVIAPGSGGSGGGAQVGGDVEIRCGAPISGGAEGSVQLLLSNGTTKRFEVNGTGMGFFAVTPVAQPADQVAFTDNTGGTASRTLAALPDPADGPITADALRDDLVANVLPVLRNYAASHADGYNDTRANVLRPLGLMA